MQEQTESTTSKKKPAGLFWLCLFLPILISFFFLLGGAKLDGLIQLHIATSIATCIYCAQWSAKVPPPPHATSPDNDSSGYSVGIFIISFIAYLILQAILFFPIFFIGCSAQFSNI